VIKPSFALAVVLGVAVFSGQQTTPPEPSQGRQVFRTEANLVYVDVHVLRNGKPVSDLTAADFQIFEDGTPQKIDKFELVRAAAPQSAIAIEPRNLEAGLDLAADPHNRVFVLFLDRYHVTEVNSLATPMALIRLLDRLLAPSDLLGVMTPHMSVRDLTLGRKTDVIRNELLQNQRWGLMVEPCKGIMGKGTHNLDQIENMYTVCYPSFDTSCDISLTAMSLIRRRREAFTLDVLRDVVRHIGARREARTAFILVSEGWSLLKDTDADARSLGNTGESEPPKIRIGPGGRIGTADPDSYNVDRSECAKHARAAANLDNERTFRDLMDDANRYNASFYVVDPAGLRVSGGHVETLRTLAENTDGAAVVNTNDIAGGMQNLIDDLSEYYLLGYYSTNTKSDGSYRSIRARVSRPGVDVRARKGYRAFSLADIEVMTKVSTAAATPVNAVTVERTTALGRLARLSPSTMYFLQAVLDRSASEIYVTGELSAAAIRTGEWRQGGEAQIVITGPDGSSAGSSRATIAQNGRGFLARVPVTRAALGSYRIVVRLTPSSGDAAPLLETAQALVTADPIGEPLAFRSAGRANPVASFLWSRAELVHVEAPLIQAATTPAVRVLDRTGGPMAVPVNVSIREENGSRWLVVDLRLAPLAPADYTLELTVDSGGQAARRFVPLRVER